MNWIGKPVLVTGAGGFIGSHLVERLVNVGARVRAFVRYNSRNSWGLLELLSKDVLGHIEILPGDLKDPEAARKSVRGCSIVFHLGALIAIPYSYRNPSDYFDTNVMGTANVCSAALEYGVEKFVHASTSEVYGSAQYVPIDEHHPLQAQSPYAASKIGADKLVESYHLSFGLSAAIIRPFNTYGPRQSARAVVPAIAIQALSGNKIHIGVVNTIRDFNYIDDTVAGFLRVAENSASVGETINIGSGRGQKIEEVVQRIVELVGKRIDVVVDPARIRPEKSEIDRLIADNRKAKRLLGWEPTVTFDVGLKKTIAWLAEGLSEYKADLYNV